MAKMAAMQYIFKSFKILLLQNQKSYDLETKHATYESQAPQRLYK